MLVHPAFKSLPHLRQFAKNGSWETAWLFQRIALPSRAEMEEYLAGATEIGFEAFFGARRSGGSREVAELSFACVAALHAATDGESFFSRLSENNAVSGLGLSISFAEIGGVNAWQSVGAFRTSPPREALQEFETLWSSLAAITLASNSSHRKAIEFARLHPFPHWFALPVSSSQPPFAID